MHHVNILATINLRNHSSVHCVLNTAVLNAFDSKISSAFSRWYEELKLQYNADLLKIAEINIVLVLFIHFIHCVQEAQERHNKINEYIVTSVTIISDIDLFCTFI